MRAKTVKLLRAVKAKKTGKQVAKPAINPVSIHLMALKGRVRRGSEPPPVVIPKNGIPRWVNDWPEENFQNKIDKGYRIVLKDGLPVTRSSGDGLGRMQYLMVAPERLEPPAGSQGSYMDGVKEHLEALDLPVGGFSEVTEINGKVVDPSEGKFFVPKLPMFLKQPK